MESYTQIGNKSSEVITAYLNIPYSVFATELDDSQKKDFNSEINEIMKYYATYEKGAEFVAEGSSGDYVPSNTRFKKVRSLIDKEARFLFSTAPTVYLNKNASGSEAEKENTSNVHSFVSEVLSKNAFNLKLLKAAKDCFIGKRVACMLNFNEETGITLTFLNSTEFLYRFDGDTLTKFSAIYTLVESSSKSSQIIKKKKYEMIEGFCYVEEQLYDGAGVPLEEGRLELTKTEFEYIPATIIFNDGLTNDTRGESEVNLLDDYESGYSKLANSDMDAERKTMHPVRYTVDASDRSTENLSSSPGSFWDIQTSQTSGMNNQAKVGTVESTMNYSEPLKTTLDRLENTMYSQVDVPNLSGENLKGMITSGKTLKALYWSLVVRCDEKWLAWEPSLRFIIKAIIQGGILYPESISRYTEETSIPDEVYMIEIENNYPLPEDKSEEKAIDLSEVSSQVMSRKAYMKKWRELTDEECEEELHQIARERALLEDSYMPEGDDISEE